MGESIDTFAEMNIKVIEGKNILDFTVDSTDTLVDLKERISDVDGTEVEDQMLYFMGYWLNEDSICLGDILSNGDEIVLNTEEEGKDKSSNKQIGQKDTWILTEETKELSPQKLESDLSSTIKLKAGKFALLYRSEGDEMGKRKYLAYEYIVKPGQTVEFRELDEKTLSVFINGE